MMWWVKARRAHTILPAALAIFVLLLVVLRGNSVALPSLTGGGTQVVLALFVPIPVVSSLAMCLDSRLYAVEAAAVRPVRSMDGGLVVAVAVFTTATSALVGAVMDDPVISAVGRNTLFLTGLMLIARALLGRPGVLIPVAWMIVICLCGFGPGNKPYFWTILPEPLGAPHAAAWAVLIFGAGLGFQFRYVRTPS